VYKKCYMRTYRLWLPAAVTAELLMMSGVSLGT